MAEELFGPTDVPRMVGPLPDLRSLNLTAEEGFLLSRIDGRTSVGSLLSLVHWDRTKTFELLESLLRKHLVNFDRAEILDRVSGNQSQSNQQSGVTSGATSTKVFAPIDRSKLERVPDLEEDRCVELLEFEQRVANADTLYGIFDIPDGADVRSVKREYRSLAMKFHPDKFFRKEIGGYRLRIEVTWKRVQEAYEQLTDPDRKATYDAEIMARQRAGGGAAKAAPPAAPSGNGGKPWMAPPPPPASGKGDGEKGPQPLPEVPNADRPRFESAFERKIKQEIRERIDKAQRHFDQAKIDFADKKYVAADSNVKLALQFDPKNDTYIKWYESVKNVLEDNIVSGLLRRGELAELSHDSKMASESYEHAITLFPENADANKALGLYLLARADNVKRAKECLAKAAAVKTQDLATIVGLVKAMRIMGMIKNAQRILEQAKAIDAKDERVVEEARELKKAT